MTQTKWAIVGRGVISLTSALRLLESGADVDIYAPATNEHQASSAAVGISTIKGLLESNKLLFDAKIKGHFSLFGLIRELLEENSSPEILKLGVFELFQNEEERKYLQKRIFHHSFSNLFDYKLYNKEQTKTKSNLAEKISDNWNLYGSYFYPSDFSFDPLLHLKLLELKIIRLGGRFIDCLVSKVLLETDCEKFSIATLPTNLSTSLDQPQKTSVFKGYEQVLLACGPGTNKVLERSKMRTFPLSYSKGSTFRNKTILPDGSIKQGRDSLLIRSGYMSFGSIEEPKKSNEKNQSHPKKNLPIEKKESAYRQNLLATRLLKLFNIEESSIGQTTETKRERVKTADLFPVFGKYQPIVDKPGYNLWVATGFHKSGFFLSDYCAQSLVKIEKGVKVDSFFSMSSPKRFFQ